MLAFQMYSESRRPRYQSTRRELTGTEATRPRLAALVEFRHELFRMKIEIVIPSHSGYSNSLDNRTIWADLCCKFFEFPAGKLRRFSTRWNWFHFQTYPLIQFMILFRTFLKVKNEMLLYLYYEKQNKNAISLKTCFLQ